MLGIRLLFLVVSRAMYSSEHVVVYRGLSEVHIMFYTKTFACVSRHLRVIVTVLPEPIQSSCSDLSLHFRRHCEHEVHRSHVLTPIEALRRAKFKHSLEAAATLVYQPCTAYQYYNLRLAIQSSRLAT